MDSCGVDACKMEMDIVAVASLFHILYLEYKKITILST
jgi:hypothetical protein